MVRDSVAVPGFGDAVIICKDCMLVLFGFDEKRVRDSIAVIVDLGVDKVLLSVAEDIKISVNMVAFGSIGSEADDSVMLGSNTRVVTVTCEASTVLSVSLIVGVATINELSLVVA